VKIHVYYVGKPRDSHANSLADDYIARCDRYVRSQMREVQPDRFDPWTKHPSATKIVLDPAGKSLDSIQFSRLVGKAEDAGRDLVFLVGGASGLPARWRDRDDLMVSLSAMTYPHELARVMLAEQIYRALATLRGHPYPK
jgi:23S rRNA (pseudouridine1915-N3)-methyltransferase